MIRIWHIVRLLACACSLELKLHGLNLETQATFESASVYLNDADSSLDYSVYYRPIGTTVWLPTMPLVSTPNLPIPRTSLLGLKEATLYEVIVQSNGEVVAEQTFKTMATDVPIAKTVVLEGGPVRIQERGSADGWIRFVASRPVDGGLDSDNAITIEGAAYVILEGLNVRGGKYNAIQIKDSQNIRVINCDISNWGRAGEQKFERLGWIYDASGKSINRDSGVHIWGSHSVVVERCYIHDPVGRANSWVFSHPGGPNAVYVVENENTVIRYNDFIGSDVHRWNDIIESAQNGSPEGGFCKDADIYGNTMLYANDDGMELDGGQMNIRVWGNHIEGTFCGVSTAPSFHGPSYIFNNLIANAGDRWGLYGDGVKNVNTNGGQGSVYVMHNTFIGGSGFGPFGKGREPNALFWAQNNVLDVEDTIASYGLTRYRLLLRNNLYWNANASYREEYSAWLKDSELEENGAMLDPEYASAESGDFQLLEGSVGSAIAESVDGLPIVSKTPGIMGKLPVRPNSLVLSSSRVRLERNHPSIITITQPADNNQAFNILKNAVFDWFEVSVGEVQEGSTVLLIQLNDLPFEETQHGAFTIKLSDGHSRTVIVTAPGRESFDPLTTDMEGVVAIAEIEDFAGAEAFDWVCLPSGGHAVQFGGEQSIPKSASSSISYTIEVPADGVYYMATRLSADAPSGTHNSFFLSLNEDPFVEVQFRCVAGWNWAGISRIQEVRKKPWYEPMHLKQGKLTLRLSPREACLIDAIALLESPAAIYH